MLGIKIKGTFLTLFPDTRLTFELRNPVGIIVDALDQVSGGFSFPIDIPIDEVNMEVIGPIHRLDAHGVLLQDEYCEVWCDGVLIPQLIGKATIKQAGRTRLSLYMIFNDIRELTDINLTELDLGGDRLLGEDEPTRVALAQDTVENPLDYDFNFCPVYNPIYRPIWDDGFPTAQQRHWQNFYSSDDGQFAEYAVCAITPFVRIDYILTRFFAYNGWTLDNQFQSTDEMKLLMIYNNYNINRHTAAAISAWEETINLINHVPFRPALDLVKALVGTFALGLFFDPTTKTVELIPFRDLIEGPVAHDWTSKAAYDYIYTTDRSFIARWRYGIDEADELSKMYSATAPPDGFIWGEALTPRAAAAASLPGIRYTESDNSVHWIDIILEQERYIRQYLLDVVKPGSEMEYISDLIPLWTSWKLETDGEYNEALDFPEIQVPTIQHNGNSPEMGPTATQCTSLRMFFYRGMQPADIDGVYNYPMGGITAYNILGTKVGDYALTWDREYGIYEQWWKLPYQMLANRKEVVRTVLLNIKDFLNFNFKQKIRIENQNYFVTRLRFTLSERGMGPTEATMITTL